MAVIKPIIGKPYFGPHDETYSVASYDKGEVRLIGRKGAKRTMSREDFVVWLKGSPRRSRRRPSDGEVRTKLGVTDAIVGVDGREAVTELVRYVTLDEPTREQTATLSEWTVWTAEAA